jgi:hypothetical protein
MAAVLVLQSRERGGAEGKQMQYCFFSLQRYELSSHKISGPWRLSNLEVSTATLGHH